MINKRTIAYIGSVLTIVLFSTGIIVMAASLSDLPSVPSNTTQATSGTLPSSTGNPAETEQTVVVPTDATASVTMQETGSPTATQPTVDVIAQSTVPKPGSSDDDENDEDDRPIDPSVQLISKDQAAAIALAQVGGTVVEIEFESEDNPPLYEIKLITDEYEYEIKVHAVTGALLDLEKERIESSDDSSDD